MSENNCFNFKLGIAYSVKFRSKSKYSCSVLSQMREAKKEWGQFVWNY